jgi:hypothetical protein
MDGYGNDDNRDIHTNPPQNVFGMHDASNVFGIQPVDVWANHTDVVRDHLSGNQTMGNHTSHDLSGSRPDFWSRLFGS